MMQSGELKRYRYFANLPQPVLDRIAAISSVRPFVAGDRILEEGAPATHLLIIKSGQVDIIYRLGDGREVTAESAVAGDVIAWSSLLEPFKLTAAVAGMKAGELITIDGAELRQLCDADCQLGYQLMTEIAKGLRDRLIGLRVQLAAAQ